MKFKVGDKVKFKSLNWIKYRSTYAQHPDFGEFYGIMEYDFYEIHGNYKNKIIIVDEIYNDDGCDELRFHGGKGYYYPQEWFTHALKPKIDKLLEI